MRMDTWLSWRHMRGSLRSPLYLVRKFILAPQLEKTHKTPPSLRAEGLLFLYGLESNPESSLQLHRRLDSLEATQWAPRDTMIADDNEADIDLYLNYPSREPVEVWQEKSAGYDERDLSAFVMAIKKSVEGGRVTALADGAYCNGGDRELLQTIDKEMGVLKLSAYAGWNTSSNTLGTVICQAVFVYLFGDNEFQKRFLAERVYEDVGYCGYVRAYVTNNLLSNLGFDYFNAGETDGEVALLVRRELNDFIEKYFTNLFVRYEIDVCRMPWKRMFEVDLSLKERND